VLEGFLGALPPSDKSITFVYTASSCIDGTLFLKPAALNPSVREIGLTVHDQNCVMECQTQGSGSTEPVMNKTDRTISGATISYV